MSRQLSPPVGGGQPSLAFLVAIETGVHRLHEKFRGRGSKMPVPHGGNLAIVTGYELVMHPRPDMASEGEDEMIVRPPSGG